MKKMLSFLIVGLLCLSTFSILAPKAHAQTIDVSAQYSSFVSARNNYKQIFGQDVTIGQTVERALTGYIEDPPPHYQWQTWAGQTYPQIDGFSIRIETIQPDYVYKIIGIGTMAGSQPSASGWVQVNPPFRIEQTNYVENGTIPSPWGTCYVRIYVEFETGRIDFAAKWYNWPALIDATAFRFAITIAKPSGTLPPFSYDTSRAEASYAYDANIKRVVMFGGRTWNASDLKSDLWTFYPETSQWASVSTDSGPSERVAAALSYSQVAKNFLLFGGGTISGEVSDTWTFQFTGPDMGTWTQVAGVAPSPRARTPMVYDSGNNLFILFGGERYVYSLGDTWAFDPTTRGWSNKNPSPSPPQCARAAMAYDAKSGKVLLLGGLNKGAGSLLSDTWLYDTFTNSWQQVVTGTAPSARQFPPLASDGNGVFYLFGGWRMDAGGYSQYLSDTWKFDTATMQWTELSPSTSPPAQSQGALMNLGSRKFILIGGWRDSPLGEVWIYDANQNTWSTEVTPPPDFEISVSPEPIVIVHVGGWNDSISLAIQSIGGFFGEVQLSFTGPIEANITIDFTENSVYLAPSSRIMVGMNISSTSAPLSDYIFTIVSESGSIKHNTHLTVDLVGNTIAIKNLINLEQMVCGIYRPFLFWRAFNDRPFSVQQNFHIAAPNGTAIYVAQNIVRIGRVRTRTTIRSAFDIFSVRTGERVLAHRTGYRLAPQTVSFPIVLNMTSHIERSVLILENNASLLFNSVQFALPEGSYIVGYPGILEGWRQAPEIVIVGDNVWPVAIFQERSQGSVDSFVNLVGESDWRSTQNTVLDHSDGTWTDEESYKLDWSDDGSFQYSSESTDQGICFHPDYS